ERFSSSDDYENYQTEDLRQVPASELPSGWGADYDVAVVVNRYTADDWNEQDRHLTEYHVVVGDNGYALSLNVPEEDAGEYEQILQDALNSRVIKRSGDPAPPRTRPPEAPATPADACGPPLCRPAPLRRPG